MPELKHIDPEDISDTGGWEDDGSFAFTCQIAFWKNDGLDHDDLSEQEQDDLFRDDTLVGYRYETFRVSRGDIPSSGNRADKELSN